MSKPSVEKRDRPADPPFPAADDPERLEPILEAVDASPAVRERAYDIAEVAEGTMWVVGISRTTVAAAAVYVAGLLEGEEDERFTQTEIAEASGASLAAISTNREELRAVYEEHRRDVPEVLASDD